MSWRSVDFQGFVDLDRRMVEQLEQYLLEKENRLGQQILNALHSPQKDEPVLPPTSTLKLSEAVEGFGKHVRAVIKSDNIEAFKGHVESVEKEINSALWNYTETLEGSVMELFQQVRHVPINRWHLTISEVVQSIKDLLVHRIEDLMWIIPRLEKSLDEFVRSFQTKSNRWKEWGFFSENHIDRQILRNLKKTENYLKIRFATFNQRYSEYMALSAKVEDYLQQMKHFPVLALLEVHDQNLYVDVFRLLKIMEVDPNVKKEVRGDTVKALKHLATLENITRVFEIYFLEFRDVYYHSSLEWKSLDRGEQHFKEALERLKSKVKDDQVELGQLIHTMSRYRLFILKNDPNPYVRSRWGFTEWIVGPEPEKSKKLLNMIYSAEELNHFFSELATAFTIDPLTQQRKEYFAQQEIDDLLHEMGQPLISRAMMKSRAEKLLEQIKQCDELGSPDLSTIYYIEDVLAKAMREDWKYQVLNEIPLFHKIYHLHLGIAEYFEDPSHAFRLERFQEIFDRIEDWSKKEDNFTHVHEVELEMNDMKTYLQDFFASIQRAAKEKSADPFLDETIQKFRQQLLEYRYLFGQFFSKIQKNDPQAFQFRGQFLFVDQYFESVENLLNELKANWEGKL